MELQNLVLLFVEDIEYSLEHLDVKWTIDHDNNAVDLKIDGKKFRVTFEEVA